MTGSIRYVVLVVLIGKRYKLVFDSVDHVGQIIPDLLLLDGVSVTIEKRVVDVLQLEHRQRFSGKWIAVALEGNREVIVSYGDTREEVEQIAVSAGRPDAWAQYVESER